MRTTKIITVTIGPVRSLLITQKKFGVCISLLTNAIGKTWFVIIPVMYDPYAIINKSLNRPELAKRLG